MQLNFFEQIQQKELGLNHCHLIYDDYLEV